MAPATHFGDLSDWFGRLQRDYMDSGDEAALAEAADLGRMMAVTEVALESVIEAHGNALAEAIGTASHAEAGRLVLAACTVLSELMLAFNLASQRVKFDSDPEQSEAPVQAANEAPAEFLRFGRDGTLGSDPPSELYCWLDQQVGREISLAARAAVAQGRIAMFETKQSAGNNRMRLIVCPFHDGGGIVALRDVQRLVNARERAFQRHKLESVGQVASGLAHEVNSFLQPILLLAQLAQEDHPDDVDLVESMTVILESTRRAAEIVHGMLLYVRPAPTTKLTLLCLPDVVSRGVAALRRSLPPKIRLDLYIDGPDAWIAAHQGELNQIIKNLVDNAIHALGGAGEVRIRVDCTTVTEVSAVRIQIPSGRYARMAISDNGPGIASALLERIFEPFFTTKAIGEGTGLGLSIVHGIIRSWGGNIIARNLPDKGAAFEVMFPLLDAPIEPPVAAVPGAAVPGAAVPGAAVPGAAVPGATPDTK